MRRAADGVTRIGIAICVSGGLAAFSLAAKAADAELVGHRAVYDLRLAESRGKQSLESARGRILYDFSGSRCEGYTLNFRQVTELDSGEGKRAISDLRSTNWEAGSGDTYRFATHNFLDGQEVDRSEGVAQRTASGVTVTLTQPEPKRADLGDVVFPSDHMRRIIVAALEGKPLLELGVYDGSESGEKVYNSLTVIGPAVAAGERPPADAAAQAQALAGLKRWPVTISYFDREKQKTDQTPEYSLSFELYQNGVARAVKLDYGDFVLKGELTALELKDAKPCP